nr:VOC family protein [Halosimplex rubrum]
MKPERTLVTLGVDDIDESIRFYRDGLGFPIRDREADGDAAFFELDGAWLSLYPRDALAGDAAVPDDGSGFSGVTLAHNVPNEAEVDGVLTEADAAGGRVVKPAGETFWGGYSGDFEIPTATCGRSRPRSSPTSKGLGRVRNAPENGRSVAVALSSRRRWSRPRRRPRRRRSEAPTRCRSRHSRRRRR